MPEAEPGPQEIRIVPQRFRSTLPAASVPTLNQERSSASVRTLWELGISSWAGLSPASPADITRHDLGVRLHHLSGALGIRLRLLHTWRLAPTAGPAGLRLGVVGVIRVR